MRIPSALNRASSKGVTRFDQPLFFYQEQFSSLPPVPENCSGSFRAQFVGPAWLKVFCRISMPIIGLPGWNGKRLSGNGMATNLLKNKREKCQMRVKQDLSCIDGKPVLSLNYSEPGTPLLLRCFRDELRQWDEQTILAFAVIRLPVVEWLIGSINLPFVLEQ